MTMYVNLLIFAFESIQGLRWLPALVRICAVRLIFIIFAYFLLIVGFGIIFWLRFGARLQQFWTPYRSCYELAMLAAGVPMDIFDDIHPWENGDSLSASLMLMVFVVLMSIIMLNFFTTIILDAYTMARDPKKTERNVGKSR